MDERLIQAAHRILRKDDIDQIEKSASPSKGLNPTSVAITLAHRALCVVNPRFDKFVILSVQESPGVRRGPWFYPHLSCEAYSLNPWCWNDQIMPKAGVLRMVAGLGTRFSRISDDDYSRVVPLSAPERRPESSSHDVIQFSQRKMDCLDLESGRVSSNYIQDVLSEDPDYPRHWIMTEIKTDHPMHPTVQIVTFHHLLRSTPFPADCKEALSILRDAFNAEVHLQWSGLLDSHGKYQWALQDFRLLPDTPSPPAHSGENGLLESHGPVLGRNRSIPIRRIVYVVPSEYGRLPIQDRHDIARTLGRINQLPDSAAVGNMLLIGPGRWATTSPSLGISVTFHEISGCVALCEIAAMHETLIPEVSHGVHIFNDLVERNLLYFAFFPGQKGNHLNEQALLKHPNSLSAILPASGKWEKVIRVIDFPGSAGSSKIPMLSTDFENQKVYVM